MTIAGLLIVLLGIAGMAKDRPAPDSADIWRQKRLNMVETQIVARGVEDSATLEAMRKVPRHLFVPENWRASAYEDEPLPIGLGQTISQPYIVALMTELGQPTKNSKVLEIGTGSGYQAAVLAEISDSVYSIEILNELASRADSTLKSLNYNVTVVCGDGYRGLPEYAPFDVIIVTAAPERVPTPLLDQLAEGGRLVIPVGTYHQELKLIRKIDGKLKETNIIPVRFVPMTGGAETEP